jgi:hypothetical protein
VNDREPEDLSLPLIGYRLRRAEREIAEGEITRTAQQVELYDLRRHQEHLVTREELDELFEKRDEQHRRAAALRREWPVILSAIIAAAGGLTAALAQLLH